MLSTAALLQREASQRVRYPVTPLYGVLSGVSSDVTSVVSAWRSVRSLEGSLLRTPLPANAVLQSLDTANDGVILRLRHLFDAGEHPVLSEPFTVRVSCFARACREGGWSL